jgi:hypothetical protein
MRILNPAVAAKGWLVATMPRQASTAERREGKCNDVIFNVYS